MMAVDQVAVLAELGVRSTQGPVQQVGKLARALGATIEPWSQPGKVEFYTVDCTAAVNISLSVIVQDVRGRDVVLLQLTRDDLIYTVSGWVHGVGMVLGSFNFSFLFQ